MRLNTPLVTSFVYNDEEYQIDLSFDNVLDVFDYLDDKSLRDYEKAEICIALLLDKSLETEKSIELWNHIFEKYIKIEHKKPIERDLKGNPMPTNDDEEDEKFIDLEKDAEYIFASFQQAYNINLFQKQGSMHWFEFQALLNGLPSNTIMQRIIQIRLWEPSKGESQEYKENMKELKKAYALEDEEVE